MGEGISSPAWVAFCNVIIMALIGLVAFGCWTSGQSGGAVVAIVAIIIYSIALLFKPREKMRPTE